MRQEIEALENNKTGTLIELPQGKKVIGSKWIFKIKYLPDGSIDKYKAGLVGKGYNQVEGIDYTDSFSPVAKMVTIRVMLTITAANRWEIHQLVINNTFLHGILNDEVYMKIP